MAGLEPTQSFHPNGFYVPVLLPFVALMHRKRLTIVAVEEYRSIALCRYRLFRISRLVVQTAGSIALARFISTCRLFARLSLILGSGIGNGTKERNTVTYT